MTSLDEDEFAGTLLKARPLIRFINMRDQPDNDRPRYRNRIDACEPNRGYPYCVYSQHKCT